MFGVINTIIKQGSMIAIATPVSPLRGVFPLGELLHRGLLLAVGGDGVWPGKYLFFSKVYSKPPPKVSVF